MACDSAAIADAFVTWLNDAGRGWTYPGGSAVTAVRTWDSLAELTSLPTLLLQVVPESWGEAEQLTRDTVAQTIEILLIFRQKYTDAGAITNSWVDARVEFVEQVARRLTETVTVELTISGTKTVYCDSWEIDRLCDPADLQLGRQFTAIVVTRWNEYRAG